MEREARNRPRVSDPKRDREAAQVEEGPRDPTGYGQGIARADVR